MRIDKGIAIPVTHKARRAPTEHATARTTIPDDDDYLTQKDVQALLKVGPITVEEMVKNGLKHYRLRKNREVVISKRAVDSLIAKGFLVRFKRFRGVDDRY